VAPVESSPALACPNCAASPSPGAFCPTCGQRNDRLRLTARALVGDLAEGVLRFDRKVPSTARALLIPGQLTLDYLQGRRGRHLRPLSLFLLLAGLHYLAWSSTRRPDDGLQFQTGAFTARLDLETDAGTRADGGTPADAGTAPGGITARLLRSVALHPERPAQAIDALESPKGQLAMVLAYVLGVALVARRRRFLLSEHLVFVLHLQAFGGLLGAVARVLGVPEGAVGAASLVYDAVAFARVYGFGWWGSTWRFALGMVVAAAVLAVFLGLLVTAYLLW
jgi:hypothetical protein